MGEITPKKQCQEQGEQKMPLYLGGARCAAGFCPEGQDTPIPIPKYLEFLLQSCFCLPYLFEIIEYGVACES